MGKLWPLSVILLSLAVSFGVQADEPPQSAIWAHQAEPEELPDLSLTDLDGKVANTGNTPTILHFWATWCVPCIAELPMLDRLADALGKQGVTVVAVSEDRGGADDVRPFLARGAPLPHLTILLDKGRKTAARLHLKALPVTLVVGADGHERARLIGAGNWDGADRDILENELGR